MTKANIIIPNVFCKSVYLYKLFNTNSLSSPFLISITILIPSLSDSSLKSEIPVIFLFLTNSAIFSINLDLFT